MDIDKLLASDNYEQIKQYVQELEQKISDLNGEIKLIHPSNPFHLIKKAIDTSITGIFVSRFGSNVIYANNSFIKLWGYNSIEDIQNASPLAFWADLEEAKHFWEIIMEKSEWIGETTAKRNDGTLFDVQVSANLIRDDENNPLYIMASFVDITDLKVIQRRMVASEKKYRSLVENLNEGVIILDNSGIIDFCTPQMENILGFDENELLGKHWKKFVPESEHEKILEEHKVRLLGNNSVYETLLRNKENKLTPVIVSAAPIFDDDDKITGILNVFTDLSNLKEIELELAKRRNLLRQVIDMVPVQIFAKDASGRFIFANKMVADLYNTSVEELVGKQQHLFHNSSTELNKFLESDNLVLKENKTLYIPEEHFTDINGTEHIIQTIKRPFMSLDTGEKSILGVALDITDIKKAERQLKLVKQDKERFYLMMSHFTRNNFQKIVYLLEYIQRLYEKDENISFETISKILKLAYQSSHAIDLVNEIFDVLKASFTPDQSTNLLSEIVKTTELEAFSEITFDIVNTSLNIDFSIDDYFSIILREIFTYLKIQDNSVKIEGISTKGSFIISISDSMSVPIPNEARKRLEKRVGDDWEYQGHYLGISLAAVVLQHYSGSLRIIPQDTGGNCFLLSIPADLLSIEDNKT